jgi:hypothetical protein
MLKKKKMRTMWHKSDVVPSLPPLVGLIIQMARNILPSARKWARN